MEWDPSRVGRARDRQESHSELGRSTSSAWAAKRAVGKSLGKPSARLAALLVYFGLTCCATNAANWNKNEMEKVRNRATFDLSCPAEQLTLTELGRDRNDMITTVGAKGCEKQATYVYVSEGSGWAMDSGYGKVEQQSGN